MQGELHLLLLPLGVGAWGLGLRGWELRGWVYSPQLLLTVLRDALNDLVQDLDFRFWGSGW